ncbi:PLP-dependent aminotransferase family protein [Kitasatospora camelliae]|uniref:PLP-dependent aminotransferase family protein n=1 Tax=Kitasatospora camelliae TaxID=3156397 RepID=A0AAU8K397_9ACTN
MAAWHPWHSTVTPPALARLLRGTRLPEAPGHRPAYRTLAAQVRTLVAEGRLPVGSRLPAERELAAELALSRTTVATAYEALRADGYLLSRRGSGSWTTLPDGARPPSDALNPVPPDQRDSVIDLGVAALPAPQPYLGAAAARALEQLPAYAAGHGNYPTGLPALREALARRYSERGLPTTPDQILVTTGAMSALRLARPALAGRGDRVAVEAPSYAHTLLALRRAGARLIPVPLARPEGPGGPARWDLADWQRVLRTAAPRLAYVIPDFHNPTGALIEEDQRRALLADARCADTVLLADETPAELGWGTPESELPRPLAALDRAARVVTVGSASKIFWGGLRIGWLRAAPALVRQLAADRAISDIGTPVLDQLIATELLTGHFSEVRAHQHERLRSSAEALAAELHRQLPAWEFTLPPGGLALWTTTGGLSGTALARAGERTGIHLAAGARFGVDGAFENYLRIPLTVPAGQAAEAVARLAAAAHLASRGGYGSTDDGSGPPI